MHLSQVFLLFVVFLSAGVFLADASIQSFSLTTGNYAKISAKKGLLISAFLLQYMLASRFGLVPIRLNKLAIPSYPFIGKRSVDTKDMPMWDTDSLLKAVRHIDVNECLLRYVCELEQQLKQQQTDLDIIERLLIQLGKSEVNPAISLLKNPDDVKLPYQTAAFMGRTGHAKTCTQTFSTCPHNLIEIRDILRSKDF